MQLALGLTLLGMAIWSFLTAMRRHRSARAHAEAAAANWSRARGRIIEAAVEESTERDTDGDVWIRRTPRVRYRFEAAGEAHEGTRAFLLQDELPTRRDAQAWLEKYLSGSEVDVFYDPGNPATAVLAIDRPARMSVVMTFLVSAALGLVGLVMTMAAL